MIFHINHQSQDPNHSLSLLPIIDLRRLRLPKLPLLIKDSDISEALIIDPLRIRLDYDKKPFPNWWSYEDKLMLPQIANQTTLKVIW